METIAHHVPPISIGLPVYNGEKYIEETLKSILLQTYEDFTLFISDNASTDRTQEICQSIALKDKRVKYLRNETNIGLARNFNRLVFLSESKYFKWSAHDDLIAPEYLEVCKEILDNEPEVILAYPKTMLIGPSGEVLGTYEDGLNLFSPTPQGRFLQVFKNMRLVNPLFGLIRSEVPKRTHLMGNYPHSDLVLLAELSLFGQFREAPHCLFFRRLHPSSAGGVIWTGNKAVAARKDKEKLTDYNPNIKVKFSFKKQYILHKHLTVILSAPIPLSSKTILSYFFLRHLCNVIAKRFYI